MRLVDRHKIRFEHKKYSTFFDIKNCSNILRTRLTYHSEIFQKLSNMYKHQHIEFAPTSKLKIKNLLHSTKDKIDKKLKPCIYKVECANDDCNRVYIGQTQRNLKIRMKEHIRSIERIEPYKSGIAQHIIECEHRVNEDCFNVLEIKSNY